MIPSAFVLSLLTSVSFGAESGVTGIVAALPVAQVAPAVDPDPGLAADAVELEPLREEGDRERPEGAVAGAVADEVLQTWNFGGRSEPTHVSNRPSYHPGTRVVVDATLRGRPRSRPTTDGARAGARLVAGLRNRGYWPFRNCFEEVAREHPDPGGKTELVATVAPSGKVVAARVWRTNLKNHAIAQCIGTELRALRLDKPIGYRVDAIVSVAIWPGDLPLLPLPRQAKPEARKPTRYRDVDRALSSLVPVFAECLVPARRVDPKLWGRLSLAFSVDEAGRATEFVETTSHFGDSRAKACVVAVLAGLNWPRPRSGSRLEFALRLAKPNPPEQVATPIDGMVPVPSSGTSNVTSATSVTSATDSADPQPSLPSRRIPQPDRSSVGASSKPKIEKP